MDNSFILCHLPPRFSYHRALEFIKVQNDPPKLSHLADALCKHGESTSEVWKALDLAQRESEKTVQSMSKLRIYSVSYWSDHYPFTLRWLDEPPWNLFFIGQIPLSTTTLAIVGPRKPNSYGIEVMESIVPKLKIRPLQIVSGLAYGIDALAHIHASESNIPNFAVLGCGLDRIYPAEHDGLAKRIILGGGGILSEFPPGTLPLAPNFPRRNRIISGLADIVWIVQGAAKSGSLHTVKHALHQGKTVVTTPGDIFSDLSELPNRLLLDGAGPVTHVRDLDFMLEKVPARTTH